MRNKLIQSADKPIRYSHQAVLNGDPVKAAAYTTQAINSTLYMFGLLGRMQEAEISADVTKRAAEYKAAVENMAAAALDLLLANKPLDRPETRVSVNDFRIQIIYTGVSVTELNNERDIRELRDALSDHFENKTVNIEVAGDKLIIVIAR